MGEISIVLVPRQLEKFYLGCFFSFLPLVIFLLLFMKYCFLCCSGKKKILVHGRRGDSTNIVWILLTVMCYEGTSHLLFTILITFIY